MITDVEFVTKCLRLNELEQERKALIEDITTYCLVNGDQKVGPVSCKVSSPNRKFDYQATWLKHGYSTGVDIENYYVIPEAPVAPAPYYDYASAVKAGKIKQDLWVVTNQEDVKKKSVKVEVK